MKCIDQASIGLGTRVLVRCDLDVPLDKGAVTETFRLDAALKTLNFILNAGGVPVIAGHMGRPGGKYSAELSTLQLTEYFNTHLLGKFELLDNLRFDPREEANDAALSGELAQKADIYVNESFATSHRESASIVGVPRLLPSYAGFQLVKEIASLQKILGGSTRALLAVIGGAKIESKRPVIQKFSQIADVVLVGGRLALEGELVGDRIHCPVDYVDNKDIGPETLRQWEQFFIKAKTIVWAGPMGAFEDEKYSRGTREIAESIAHATRLGCFTVAGGGDTIAAIAKFGLMDGFSFISTGGSAMLDFLVSGTLPGIEAL